MVLTSASMHASRLPDRSTSALAPTERARALSSDSSKAELIRTIGTARDPLAIQKQFIAFVGADVNSQGRCRGFKLPSKTQKHGLAPPARKVVGMRRSCRIPEIRMPDPRGFVNGLNRENPGVAQVQVRRQKHLANKGQINFCREI